MLNQTVKHIFNARLPDRAGLWRIDIDNQRITAIVPQPEGEILPESRTPKAAWSPRRSSSRIFTSIPPRLRGTGVEPVRYLI